MAFVVHSVDRVCQKRLLGERDKKGNKMNNLKTIMKRIAHKFFNCPTFWRLKPFVNCVDCGCGMKCYWDGNDCKCGTINICNKCYHSKHEKHDH